MQKKKYKKIIILVAFIVFFWCPLVSIGQNIDWKELQGKIDSAIAINGIVQLKRNYKIDQPLVAARWTGKDYGFFTIQIIGKGTITALFNDAPALSIHKGKGVIVKGISFEGQYKPPSLSTQDFYNSNLSNYSNSGCRDSRYSPYTAIAIDPFMYQLPPDGGYPTLQLYYRGAKSVSGSTGIRIEDCSISGFIIGAITSPNGYTLNAEIISFVDMKLSDCRIGIAGNQPQEKMNRVINLKAVGTIHTLFAFGRYGKGHPGNWIIDGVKITGRMVNLIFRHTGKFFPMYMNNIEAESLGSIGEWQTSLSDVLSNSTIRLVGWKEVGNLPDYVLTNGGLAMKNSSIQYMDSKQPLIFAGRSLDQAQYSNMDYKGNKPVYWVNYKPNALKSKVNLKKGLNISKHTIKLPGNAAVGDIVIFYEGNYFYQGCGMVISVESNGYKVGNLSPGIYNGKSNKAGILL